jgi:hypothetical protein
MLVGIDMSLTSPGLCVFHVPNQTHKSWPRNLWQFYGFAQKKKDANKVIYSCGQDENDIQISFLPPLPSKEEQDIVRYSAILDPFFEILKKEAKPFQVILEGYAFAAHGGNSFKLMELTGIFKYRLWHEFQQVPIIYPPNVWKKRAVGYGHASKQDYVDNLKKKGPQFNIMEHCPPYKKDPPSPYQDMAAACNLILSYLS